MTKAAAELSEAIAEHLPRLRTLSEEEVMRTRGPGKWVKKEILGHLIDSALNNQQRFVRAQLTGGLIWPGYEQDAWVSVQNYKGRSWPELVELWSQLNGHIAHVMANVPASRLSTKCVIGDDAPVTLEWLMNDYVCHLRHHLAQIFA